MLILYQMKLINDEEFDVKIELFFDKFIYETICFLNSTNC